MVASPRITDGSIRAQPPEQNCVMGSLPGLICIECVFELVGHNSEIVGEILLDVHFYGPVPGASKFLFKLKFGKPGATRKPRSP